MPITHWIPHDEKLVVNSCNQGIPFLISHPKAPISKAILGFGRELAGRG
jgi:MinD-like ATPase involved in chromosome partitioning or flagellar assembly